MTKKQKKKQNKTKQNNIYIYIYIYIYIKNSKEEDTAHGTMETKESTVNGVEISNMCQENGAIMAKQKKETTLKT